MTINDFLEVVAILALVLAIVRILHMFRGRAMRAFAVRWGLQYIGPAAPERWWWNPSHLKINSPVPHWFSVWHPSGMRIRQIWNVIEGQQSGVLFLIFDCVVGEYRGGSPWTVVACQTEQSPFGAGTSSDHVAQAHGWTILHGDSVLWFIGTRRLDRYMRKLRVGSTG